MAKGKPLAETQERRAEPSRWEKGTVLGPERGLGAGLPPREKVDVPVEVPDDMEETGQRSEWLWDLSALPGPVVLVTTSDTEGNVNCAPKNWCTFAGPRRFVFVCSADHDTYMNAQTTREFVVNVPGDDLVDRLHALARRGAASWEDELTRAGLTPVPSREVRPPRVRECRVHLECRVEMIHEVSSVHELRSPKAATDVLVLGRVVAASADAQVVRAPTYRERVQTVRPLVLTPLWDYSVVDAPREVPGAWDLEY